MRLFNFHRHWKTYKILLFALIILIMIIGVGFFGTRWQSRLTERSVKNKLIYQARELASALDPLLIRELSFSPGDTASAVYQQIQNQIRKYGNLIEQRGIYTLALQEGELRLGPNTLPDKKQPGVVYKLINRLRLTEEVQRDLHQGKTVILEPLHDENDYYFTALSSVTDPKTGKIIIIAGIDFIYETYRDIVWSSKKPIVIMTVIIAVIFILSAIINLTWRKRKELLFEHLETLVTFILGFLITFTISFIIYNREHIEQGEIYEQISNRISTNTIQHLIDIKNNINILASFHESSDYVDDQEFALFTDPLTEISKSWWYHWADYIQADMLKRYEKETAANKGQEFFVWERTENDRKIPVRDRPVYFPVRHISPTGTNTSLIGFDMGSEHSVMDAISDAVSTKMITATPVVSLYFDEKQSPGILIIQPAFKHKDKDYPCEFSCDLLGFAVGTLQLSFLLENTIEEDFNRDIFLYTHLVDLSDPEGMRIIANYPEKENEHLPLFVEKRTLHQYHHFSTYPLFMFGRPFALVIHPTEEFSKTFPSRTTRLAAVTGIFLTLLLTFFIGYLRTRENRLSKLVSQRTRELREREEKYRLLTDNSIDVIWLMDPDMTFRFVSPAVKSMLGYLPSEMTGKHLSKFCDKKNLSLITKTVHTSMEKLPENGGVTFDAELIRRDGSSLPVEIGEKLLLNKSGEITGIQGITRDITQRKHMERQLKERVKELACISAVREETLKNLPEDIFCRRVIQHLKNAIQFKESAFPVIELEGRIYSPGSKNIHKKHNHLQALIKTGQHVHGRIMVFYLDDKPFILPEEQNLVNNIADTIGLWFEWKRTQAREIHAKQVLLGIRNVNQLIVKELDPLTLIQKATVNLTETLGYEDAWISLVDDRQNVIKTVHSGHDVCGYAKHAHKLNVEGHPACIRDVLASNQLEVYHGIESACGHCPFSDKVPAFAVFSAPLSHEEKIYGILTVGVPEEFAELIEEQNLFIEVAEDIGFSLYKIELEEKRKHSEQQLLRNLQEKEVLLQEIHHRVKNNLNVISSLLKLQARKITNKEDAIDAFQNSSNRIQAMALVHKKLYDTQNFDAVNIKSYFSTLAGQLVSIYRQNKQIKINTEVENIALDINTAIPCGLILNELISNSLKHAFTGKKTGEITITVLRSDPEHVELCVRDNGIGLPEDPDLQKNDSLGLHLVTLLTDQIKGELTIDSGHKTGATFKIRFPYKNKGLNE